MALNTGKILMRRGQEVNFDPDKMSPGEWAVSLDTRYVRMCFAPGICVRMATYEAFEADLEEIQQIIEECRTIDEAVTRINDEITDKAEAVAEYTEQARQYRDEAKQYRDEAQNFVGDNYLTEDSAVDFTEASTRENILTSDSIKTILGKLKKWLTDLKPHAFVNTTNNLLATQAGTALDATQGKVLNDKIESMPKIIFSNQEPTTIEENTIVMVYEEL